MCNFYLGLLHLEFFPTKFKDPKVYLVNGCQKAVDNVLYIVHPAPCIVKVS